MRWRRWLVWLPAVVALIAAAGLLGSVRYLTVSVAIPLLVALMGVAVSAGWFAWDRSRRREASTAGRVRQEVWSQAHQQHLRFLARLDHELKNPVTAVRAAIGALRAPGERSLAERDSLLTSIDAQTARLATLVADLRKLADLETREIERVPVDVAAILGDAVGDLREQLSRAGAAERTIALTISTVPWPLSPVLGDQDLLYLAVYNLLTNAVKFSPVDTPVEVRARDENGVVVIEVADSGMGIPDGEQGLVFDELARGAQARGIPGSGIGLSLVRVIASRHGGEVALMSRPGSGTSVTLRLPGAGAVGRSSSTR